MKRIDVHKRHGELQKILTKKFLYREYIIDKKSTHKIAKEIKSTHRLISNYLKKFNIKTRTLSEASNQPMGKNHWNYNENKPKCIDCKKKLNPTNIHVKRCWECYNKFRAKEKNYCIDCHKELKDSRSKKCKSCANKGKNNPGFIHGKAYEPYPLDWNKTFKEQIRKRDNYKCQLCGIPEIECNKKLHVHHKDYNKKHIKPSNLISLCNSCHTKTNFNRKYWINYFQKKIKELI